VKLLLVRVGVPRPVTVIVTLAVAVVVDAPGTYCTIIVQFPPGFTTTPEVQVPPLRMENVPPAVPTFVIAGSAVNAIVPVAAAALLTVTEPVFVFVLAGLVVSLGSVKLSIAPVTVKLWLTAGAAA
jgi:hypothetical protein